MPTATIDMSADGQYKIHPPFIVVKKSDLKITWKLKGKNWEWMSKPPGIMCDTSTLNPPYSAWPGTTPAKNGSGDYEADAKTANTGTSWLFYKWTFSVLNTSTNQIVQIDPDIGNEPQP